MLLFKKVVLIATAKGRLPDTMHIILAKKHSLFKSFHFCRTTHGLARRNLKALLLFYGPMHPYSSCSGVDQTVTLEALSSDCRKEQSFVSRARWSQLMESSGSSTS